MSTLMSFNQVPFRETLYGMGLCLFFLILIIILDYQKFYYKYRCLKSLEKSVDLSLNGLEPPESQLEDEYHILLALLQEAKIKEQDEMERKIKDFKEYFTLWVHQIKTPISAMRLLLQEKHKDADLSEEMDELFAIEQYVEMALQYMRLDSESTDFLLHKTDLDSVIKEAVHKYARLFIRKKVKLDYSNVNTIVLTDEKWIEFVIEQILSNAIKYTPSGVISISMERDNVLTIRDNGIGIRAEDLPRVFEKGYTGYNGHIDKHSTGIGLYLCSRIMKKLSHEIKIESEEGKGTKVLIIFPEKDIGISSAE